jgi:hypothetical protein
MTPCIELMEPMESIFKPNRFAKAGCAIAVGHVLRRKL